MGYIEAGVGIFGVLAAVAGWVYTTGRSNQRLAAVVEDVNDLRAENAQLRLDLVELRAVAVSLDPNLSPRVGRAEVAIGRIETVTKNTEKQLTRLDTQQGTIMTQLGSVSATLHEMVGVLLDRGQMRPPPIIPG